MTSPILADLQNRVLAGSTATAPASSFSPAPPAAAPSSFAPSPPPAQSPAPSSLSPLGVLVPVSVKDDEGEITVQVLFGPEHMTSWDSLCALLGHLQQSGVPLKVWSPRRDDRGGGFGGGGGGFGGGGRSNFGGGGGFGGGRRGWR